MHATHDSAGSGAWRSAQRRSACVFRVLLRPYHDSDALVVCVVWRAHLHNPAFSAGLPWCGSCSE
jgi:hypothetical protein